MKRNRAATIELPASGRTGDMEELQAIARRGMRGNADFMTLIQDQVQAHRLAAAASTLPRVRLHLSTLADSLETLLGAEEPQPADGEQA